MSIIVPSNHTRIGAWINSTVRFRGEIHYNSILYNSINRHARISTNPEDTGS